MKKRLCSKKKALVVLPSDIRLFYYLYQFKVATADQIFRDLNWGKYKSAVYRRTRQLIGSKHIKKVSSIRGESTVFAYTLCPQALDIILGRDKNVCIRRQAGSASIGHDLDLVDIRASLCGLRSTEHYFTENVLQAKLPGVTDSPEFEPFVRLRSDAAIKIRGPKGTVFFGIEYESFRKIGERYQAQLGRYFDEDKIVCVLYICKDASILSAIQSAEKKYYPKEKEKIYYTLLENVQNSSGEILFRSTDGHIIKL